MSQCYGRCTERVGLSLAPDTPGPGFMQWHRSPTPPQTHTPAPVSAGVPGTGFYLMELSDETSRSESSVSLGGGGGSLSGTAVKAGDFLEKNTRCHLEPSRKQKDKKHQLSPWGKQEGCRLLRYRGMLSKSWGGKKVSSLFNLTGNSASLILGGSERLRNEKSVKSQHGDSP